MNTIWVSERLLTNSSMKNGKSALIYYTVTQQTQITVRHLFHFAQPVKWLWQQKSIYYYYMCIVHYVMIRIQKDCQTIFIRLKELFLSRPVQTIQVLHPSILNSILNFLWKTYSLVSCDFCNLSVTRVFVGTNGECYKYKNCWLNDWSFPLLIAEFYNNFWHVIFYSISVNPYFFFEDGVK